jgi:hypothetical protein
MKPGNVRITPDGHIYLVAFLGGDPASLPLNEVITYLRNRSSALQEALEYVQGHRTEQLAIPEVPQLAAAIFDHTIAHTRAELEWVMNLLHKLESGEDR